MQPCLLTGGSGRLGSPLRDLLPDIIAPPHSELDITSARSWSQALLRYQPKLVVQAAAYTDVKKAEKFAQDS